MPLRSSPCVYQTSALRTTRFVPLEEYHHGHASRLHVAIASLVQKLVEFNGLIHDGAIDASILDLVAIRASQINGCGFCVDASSTPLSTAERALRLHHLTAWRESTLFVPQERAALAWTEALTTLAPLGVADDMYERVRAQLSEKQSSDLTFEIVTINAWNRVNIAFKVVPGSVGKALLHDQMEWSRYHCCRRSCRQPERVPEE